MGTDAYGKVILDTGSQRQLEAQALLRMARLLAEALTADDRQALIDATLLNSRLWLFFYSQIESEQVALPAEVERNIILLASYVVKVSPKAMTGDEDTVNSLVSINRNIAAGLSETPQFEAPPPAAMARFAPISA